MDICRADRTGLPRDRARPVRRLPPVPVQPTRKTPDQPAHPRRTKSTSNKERKHETEIGPSGRRRRSSLAPAAFAGRGSDGKVNIIYWQAPSILNPYLSGGTKDIESSSLVIEPLARYDQDGNLVPYLAADIPTVGNGGVVDGPEVDHLEAQARPEMVGRLAGDLGRRGLHRAILHGPRRRLRPAVEIRGRREGRGGRRPDRQGHLQGTQAEPLSAVHRRPVADHPGQAVRQLPGRQGADLHRRQLRPDRHRPLRRHRVQAERRDPDEGQRQLSRSRQAGLRDVDLQGRRRRGRGGARGAGDRRIRLRLEPAAGARRPGQHGQAPARAMSIAGFGTLVERIWK